MHAIIPSTEERVLRKKLKCVCLCRVKGQKNPDHQRSKKHQWAGFKVQENIDDCRSKNGWEANFKGRKNINDPGSKVKKHKRMNNHSLTLVVEN